MFDIQVVDSKVRLENCEMNFASQMFLLLYGHVYVWPTLGGGNFEDRDNNAERWKAILLAKLSGGML